MKRDPALFFLFIAVILSVHLLVMDQYGLTWDFHHHFLSGLYMLRQPIPESLLAHLPFTEPYPITSVQLPFGPLMTVMPVVTYLLLFEKLKVLAFDNAYNIAVIGSGVAGIWILFLFLREAAGRRVAWIGAILLTLYPRFVGDLHNNMKDVPQAAAFTFAVYMYWRFAEKRLFRDLLAAAVALGIAFNMKINTVFMPVVAAVWSVFLLITGAAKNLAKPFPKISIRSVRPFILYSLFSVLFAVAIWWPFWDNPWERLMYIPRFFSLNTVNIEVVYYGQWYCSSSNVPWHYPFGYLLAVTPLPVTILFFIGLTIAVRDILRRKPLPSLLLFWFFIPLLRYLSPKTGVMDGIRHFQEVIYPMLAIAAIGGDRLITRLNKTKIRLGTPFAVITVIYLVTVNIIYHPYQNAYFSEVVGGIRGAFGRFDIDYWGTSQKNAVAWLNENARENAVVYIAMLPDVSAKYLRPDLLARVNTTGFDTADYVVVLNRQSFFYRYFYLWEYFLRRTPVYTVANQGIPLTWIYDNKTPATARQKQWWQGESPCIRKYWN